MPFVEYSVQTNEIQSCDTIPTQTTLASHSILYTVQIQSFLFSRQ